jgi:membrane peptidoglycan carboxypeptidase
MGITTPLPEFPSIALGAQNCTPLEMCSAYSTLPTGGTHNDPTAIVKVIDSDGKSLFEHQPHPTQAVKPQIARATTDVLEGVVSQGTATAADIGRPEAGKTGTSQLNRDCWFIGYTPQLCTAVWVGYTTERTVVVDGSNGFGGTVAAPIWAAFMNEALAGLPALNFPKAKDPLYDASKFDLSAVSSDLRSYNSGSSQSQNTPAPTPPKKKTKKTGGTGKGTGTGTGGTGTGTGGTGTGTGTGGGTGGSGTTSPTP